jgi:hypothetical protein
VGWVLAVLDLLNLLSFVGGEQPRAAAFDGDYAAVLLMGPGLVNGQSRQRKRRTTMIFRLSMRFSFVVN